MLLTWNVETDKFEDTTLISAKEFTNIIATFDSSLPQRLTLACHFDSEYAPESNVVIARFSCVLFNVVEFGS